MSLIKPCKSYYQTPFISSLSNLQKLTEPQANLAPTKVFNKRTLTVRCSSSGQGGGDKKPEKRSFLTLEEAGLVEVSGLGTHEKFLCRLTISSLNLLRVISEQEGCPIEELNAGRVCDWFLKDKLKREQDIDTAVLQWDDSDFLL